MRTWRSAAIHCCSARLGPAFANGVLVVKSNEVNYSIVNRCRCVGTAKMPIGRALNHLIRSVDESKPFLTSTLTNELLELEATAGKRQRIIPGMVDS